MINSLQLQNYAYKTFEISNEDDKKLKKFKLL